MPIPVIKKMEVWPVAGHDCMELNLSGAHAPFFTRNVVVLTDSTGAEGIESVSGVGLMIGLKTTKPAPEILAAARERGVLALTAKEKIRLLPALNIPMEQLKEAAEILKDCCKL